LQNAGDVQDRAVHEGWILFAKEEVTTNAAACIGFREVACIDVDSKDHVTGGEANGGVWMGCEIVQ